MIIPAPSRVLFGLFLAVVLLPAVTFALAVPPAPPLEKPVVDQTNTLTPEQIDELSRQITTSRQTKPYQLGILMIASLEDRDIEGYSLDVARTWGIGEKATDNGVLLLIVKDERKLRIEVGRGLEGELTDAESGRIIRNVIAPEFREEHYYDGIQKGIASIQAQVEGRADPASADPALAGASLETIAYLGIFGIMIVSWIVSMLARTKSWWAGGVVGGGVGTIIAAIGGWTMFMLLVVGMLTLIGLLFDWAVSRNYRQRTASGRTPAWWAGGTHLGGGGFSGGGSFGGGGFSGGGSSGSW